MTGEAELYLEIMYRVIVGKHIIDLTVINH